MNWPTTLGQRHEISVLFLHYWINSTELFNTCYLLFNLFCLRVLIFHLVSRMTEQWKGKWMWILIQFLGDQQCRKCRVKCQIFSKDSECLHTLAVTKHIPICYFLVALAFQLCYEILWVYPQTVYGWMCQFAYTCLWQRLSFEILLMYYFKMNTSFLCIDLLNAH